MGRTEIQKEIDSWIAEKVQTEALDKYIKEQLSWYPGFSKFKETDVLNAIETVYLEIEPEEQYDPWIWTIVVERALAMLEPHKDKLFKIEFQHYQGYIKEMVVGYKWIECNLHESVEKACFSLGVDDYFETDIDLEEDNVFVQITRIS